MIYAGLEVVKSPGSCKKRERRIIYELDFVRRKSHDSPARILFGASRIIS